MEKSTDINNLQETEEEQFFEENERNLSERRTIKPLILLKDKIYFILCALSVLSLLFTPTALGRFLSAVGTISILLIVPGVSISRFWTKTPTMYSFSLSVVLSLCFWTFIGEIFILSKLIFNKLTISLIFIFFVGMLNAYYYYYNTKKPTKVTMPSDLLTENKKGNSSWNIFLFLSLTILTSAFALMRFPGLPVGDPWYHARLTEIFSTTRNLNGATYRGDLNYHFIGTLTMMFTELNVIEVGRIFGFVQIIFATLQFFVLMRILIKNDNIAVITSIIFLNTQISPTTGTITSLNQYWPTALCILFGMQAFILFFQRYTFLQKNEFKQYTHNKRYYALQTLIFLCLSFTHYTNFYGYALLFIGALFFLTLKNKHYYKELLFYCILTIFHFVTKGYRVRSSFLSLSIIEDTTLFGIKMNVYLLLFVISLAAITFCYYYYKFLEKDTFSQKKFLEEDNYDRFNLKENSAISLEKKYFFKYILPPIIVIVPLLIIISMMDQMFPGENYFPIEQFIFITLVYMIFTVIFAITILSAQIFRYYSIIGKIFFIMLTIIVLVLVAFELLNFQYFYSLRLIIVWIPVFTAGFGFYLKFIKKNKLKVPNNRKILAVFTIFTVICSMGYNFTIHEDVTASDIAFMDTTSKLFEGNNGEPKNENVESQSASSAEFNNTNGNFTSFSENQVENHINNNEDTENTVIEKQSVNDRDLILAVFHFRYPYEYYGYNSSVLVSVNSTYYEYLTMNNFSTIEEYNELEKSYKDIYENEQIQNLFLLVDSSYTEKGILLLEFNSKGALSHYEFHRFDDLAFMNRIAVSNNERTLYWVHKL